MAYAALIGAEVKRREDPRLVQGQGTYVSDLRLPGMLYVAIARSPYAHARIVSIDKATALTLPGVVAVYTGTDLLDLCQPLPLASSGEGGSG